MSWGKMDKNRIFAAKLSIRHFARVKCALALILERKIPLVKILEWCISFFNSLRFRHTVSDMLNGENKQVNGENGGNSN